MTVALAPQPFQAPPAPAIVANVMRPPLTTVEHAAHVARAAQPGRKILEIHQELPGRIHIILIRQQVGF